MMTSLRQGRGSRISWKLPVVFTEVTVSPEAPVWMWYSWYTKVAVLMSLIDRAFSASTCMVQGQYSDKMLEEEGKVTIRRFSWSKYSAVEQPASRPHDEFI